MKAEGRRPTMSTRLTASELAFEHWCQLQGIEYRRVREAKAQGHKRPAYAMRVIPHWCFVEIKEFAETPADLSMLQELQSGDCSRTRARAAVGLIALAAAADNFDRDRSAQDSVGNRARASGGA
jgi:hypothetical protein